MMQVVDLEEIVHGSIRWLGFLRLFLHDRDGNQRGSVTFVLNCNSRFTALAVAGCDSARQNVSSGDFTVTRQSEDIAAIKQFAEDWRSGWLAGDVDTLLSLYANDPVLMPWGQPAVFGKDAIRPLYQSVFKEYRIKSETTLMDVEVFGDLGYFWCTYRLTAMPKAGGESLEEEGKSVFIVKREHGAWKIARLIDNSDRAPTGG